MDATTGRLVDFALGVRFSDLKTETVDHCKRRLIDAIACGVAAYREPICEKVRLSAHRYSSPTAVASVIGCKWKTMPDMAAFANGVLIRCLDMTDTYLCKTPGHPSDTIAAVLSVGEAVKADGPAVLSALAVAYDTFCTFGDAVDIHSHGWDQPVPVGLGSVIAAGKILQLDREQLAHAVALTLAPNMAMLQTRRGELSHWKTCAAPNGVRNAVFAAYLAQDGYTGPSDVFEGKYGLWHFVGTFDWQLPKAPVGGRKVEQTHIKCFPLVYYAQTAAMAGIALRKGIDVEDISEVLVESFRLGVEMNGTDPSRWAPKTHETADHSLPYIVAIALLDGNISDASFDHPRLEDPRVLALMKKIKVREAADLTAMYPETAPTRLTIRLASGDEVRTQVDYPKGHILNPLTDAELNTKFRDCFRNFGPAEQCERLLTALWNLESCDDIGQVFELLAISP